MGGLQGQIDPEVAAPTPIDPNCRPYGDSAAGAELDLDELLRHA